MYTTQHSFGNFEPPSFHPPSYDVDAFGLHIHTENAPPDEPLLNEEPPETKVPNGSASTGQASATADDTTFLKPPQQNATPRPSVYETHSVGSQPYIQQLQVPVPVMHGSQGEAVPYYEPKIAEQLTTRSKGSILVCLHQDQSINAGSFRICLHATSNPSRRSRCTWRSSSTLFYSSTE